MVQYLKEEKACFYCISFLKEQFPHHFVIKKKNLKGIKAKKNILWQLGKFFVRYDWELFVERTK